MVSSSAQTIKEYLAELPADRREALTALRKVVKANLPKGYKEGMQFGLIGYYIPLSRYPNTYNGKPLGVISLGSQSRHMAIYLMSVYSNPDLALWFKGAFAKSGKRLNMGKSCVRFNKLADLPLDVIGDAVSRVSVNDFIASYEAAHAGTAAAKKKKKAKAKAPAKSAAGERPKKKIAKKATKARRTKKAATNKVGERPTEEMLAKKAAKKAAGSRGADRPKKKVAKKTFAKKAASAKAGGRPPKKTTKKTTKKKTTKKATTRSAARTKFVKTATRKKTAKKRGR